MQALRLDTFRLRTLSGDLLATIRRDAERATADQTALARRVVSELELGLQTHDPDLVRAAQQIVDALDGGGTFDPSPARELRPSLDDAAFGAELLRRLQHEIERGRVVLAREQIAPLTDRREMELPELPPLAPAQREPSAQTFEVRFVDEIGRAISGIDAEFTADGPQTRPTNAAGIALLDGVQATRATVSVLDTKALSELLDPRWDKPRPGAPPKESNTTETVFRGAELGPFPLKPALPNTVVVKPPLGKLFLELWDKSGRVRHANCTYRISGPQPLEGTTDDDGRLLHEDVFPGDYQLSLALEFFEEGDPDRAVDIVESPLVVLEPNEAQPQVRLLGAVPRSVLARLHFFFNTNKTFLLPTALPGVKKLRRLYLDNAPCKLLIVGHADTAGAASYNDQLSLERARATLAYLKDDVEGWYEFYGSDIDAKKRWGKVEDHLMLTAMPGFSTKLKSEDPVRWYQRTRGLEVDGKAGSQTRHALIEEYMSLDGVSLTELAGEIEAVAHGCGENFPLDDTGEALDAAPEDDRRDAADRRVELFFFDPEFGITPPPPGLNSKAGSPEYPLWRARAREVVDLEAGDPDAPEVTFVELADAHFRTNSAVVLPEGEAPDAKGAHRALAAVGLFAQALRFNQEHPGLSVLVAGHTDSVAGDDFNDELSRQRAELALALLVGDRDSFKTLANGRHQAADINQILSWVPRAFEDLTFDCEPRAIDAAVDPAKVQAFQRDFNRNKLALGSSAADLAVDGSVGELTWGAFFDCYDFALQQELGEDATGLVRLRGQLEFVDDSRRSLGFGERFPIEELGADHFRSQTNRRVEILFFEPGEEPDLGAAEADPETSELYLPGFFQRTPLPPMVSAKPWFADFDAPTAQMQQSRTLSLAAPGLPPDTTMVFTLRFETGEALATIAVASSQDAAAAVFSEWDAPQEVPFVGDLQAGQPFPVTRFEFEVEGGGRKIQSRTPLTYADALNVQLVLDHQDGTRELLANESYVLSTLWGRRQGQTDAQGLVNEAGLPPGGVSVALRDRFLVGTQALPFGWDRDIS